MEGEERKEEFENFEKELKRIGQLIRNAEFTYDNEKDSIHIYNDYVDIQINDVNEDNKGNVFSFIKINHLDELQKIINDNINYLTKRKMKITGCNFNYPQYYDSDFSKDARLIIEVNKSPFTFYVDYEYEMSFIKNNNIRKYQFHTKKYYPIKNKGMRNIYKIS